MLKLIGWVLKVTALGIVVLILGNLVQWRGKTISDQVKTQMSHAERSEVFQRVREISQDVVQTAAKSPLRMPKKNFGVRSNEEDIPVSERQKLKALIRELNGSNSD